MFDNVIYIFTITNLHYLIQQLCENQQKDKETNTSACKTLVSAISTIEQNITATMRRSETKILKDEVLKQQQGIIKIWKSQINKRKQLYWHSLNCENTAAIYATWIQKDKKIIPKKFLLKFIRNEDPQEKRIRQQAVINEFQNEINLLNVRAERHHTNCKRTDDEFSDFLSPFYKFTPVHLRAHNDVPFSV